MPTNTMTTEAFYPCPECGKLCLVYDGALVWRSGPRPPHGLARKDLDFLAVSRADYERECHYHCANCGAEFFEDVDSSLVHLYGKKGAVRYLYNVVEETWQYEFFDQVEREWKVMSFDKAVCRWMSRNRDEKWKDEVSRMGFLSGQPQVWRLYYRR